MLDLLGIEAERDGSTIVLPVREAIGSSSSAIHVEGRSAYDVLEAFTTGIEVPAAHLDAGLAPALDRPLPEEERILRVHSSEDRPDEATVRVTFRDRWFYVDSTDTQSKRAFSFLRTLVGLRLTRSGADQQAPVLTVPVN